MALVVAQVLYLFAPLLVAAAASGVVLRFDLLAWLKRPLDGGRTFRGRRVFGDSKTWRGVAVAASACVVTIGIQKHALGAVAAAVAVLDYGAVDPFWMGLAMGGGAMLGELPNSFTKRQLGIAPGSTSRGRWQRVLFYVWDQVDLLTTAWPLLCFFWVTPTAALVAASFAVTLVVHPLVALIGFLVHARKSAR